MAQQSTFPSKAVSEGIVVWDQRGVVVRWPNGDSSHFPWETLRHVSLCEDCREQSHQNEAVAQRSNLSTISPTL